MRGTEAPFSHTDGRAGQTPRQHVEGIRSFSVLRQRNDPSPVLVFDHGSGYVEAGLNEGDDTIVGQANVADLPAGHFAVGRVVLSHQRYIVTSTMHATGHNLPGEFRNLHILGNDVTIDQATFQRGDYRFVFHTGGQDWTQQGSQGTTPNVAPGSRIDMVVEGEETALYFELGLDISPEVTSDVHASITLNMHHCFRWDDEELTGYAADVFDSTPTGFEPVRQFGANTYTITFE
jgi:hypothetical protein